MLHVMSVEMYQGRFMTLRQAGLSCALLGVCLYLNSLQGGLVFDDTAAVVSNDDVKTSTPWSNLLWNDFWGTRMDSIGSHKSYRPLTVATFRLNYMLHELQPLGYHLVNVLLHSAVCYLYVLLCGVVFSEVWPALIAGLLFAVHPIHTEAVCGVVGRAELLSAIFFILSFNAYEKSKQYNGSYAVMGTLWLLGSLVSALASMLCKEQGITVVAVCVAYDLLQNFQVNKQPLLKIFNTLLTDLEKIPTWLIQSLKRTFIVTAFAIIAVSWRVSLSQGGPHKDIFHKNVNPPIALDTPYRQLNWLYLCFVNLWLLLNPWNLNVDWRFGGVPLINSLMDPLNLLTLLTLVCVAAVCVWSVSGSGERHRTAVLGLSLLILPYLPASNLFLPVGFVVAERVLYLPSMGFCMLVGYGAWHLLQTKPIKTQLKLIKPSLTSKTWKTLIITMIAYITITYSIKTLVRNPEWQSHIQLFTSGLRFNPRNGLLLSNLGKEVKDTGDWERAEKLIMKGVEVSPTHSGAYINLGKIRYHSQKYEEAQEPLRKALELIPEDGNGTAAIVTVSYMLAVSMSLKTNNVTKLEEAIRICDQAIRRKPSEYTLFLARSSILLDLNRTEEALFTIKEGLKRNGSCYEFHVNRGTAYSQLGEIEKAKEAFRTALSLYPNSLLALKKLAVLCSQDGEHTEAIPLWEKVKQLEPTNADAYNGLATGYFVHEQFDKCEEVLLEGVKLFPKHTHLAYNLGNLYFRKRRNKLAVHYLQLTLELTPGYLNTESLLNKAIKRLEQSAQN